MTDNSPPAAPPMPDIADTPPAVESSAGMPAWLRWGSLAVLALGLTIFLYTIFFGKKPTQNTADSNLKSAVNANAPLSRATTADPLRNAEAAPSHMQEKLAKAEEADKSGKGFLHLSPVRPKEEAVALPAAPTTPNAPAPLPPVDTFAKRRALATGLLNEGNLPSESIMVPGQPLAASARPDARTATAAPVAAAPSANKITVFGAGEKICGRLDFRLSSRVPGTPARGIIECGPLKGAILMGSHQNVNNEYLMVFFTSLTWNKRTWPIAAMAIDEDKRSSIIVDEVKSDATKKLFLNFLSGMLSGYSSVNLQSGRNSSVIVSSTGSASSTSNPTYDSRTKTVAALDTAMSRLNPTVQQYLNTINEEVLVNPDKEITILFLSPLEM